MDLDSDFAERVADGVNVEEEQSLVVHQSLLYLTRVCVSWPWVALVSAAQVLIVVGISAHGERGIVYKTVITS